MYDYLEQVTADVRDYVEQEIDLTEWAGDRDGLEEKLNDDLWTCDSVTGNASGSYYCNTWKAEEALAHNWDLLAEALEEFGQDGTDVLKEGAEAMDVTIRCYLLGQAISAVLDDLEEDGAFEEEEEEEEEDLTHVAPCINSQLGRKRPGSAGGSGKCRLSNLRHRKNRIQ